MCSEWEQILSANLKPMEEEKEVVVEGADVEEDE